MPGLKAIVDVHKEWGDRKNRVWARMKYVVWKQGIQWYRDQVRALGVSFDMPNEDHHPGQRNLHHGWSRQESNGKWAYGAYIECGRLHRRRLHRHPEIEPRQRNRIQRGESRPPPRPQQQPRRRA